MASSLAELFATECGSAIGSPTAPLIKVTGNACTYQRMIKDMDFNASVVLRGERSLDEAADDLVAFMIATAAGQRSKPGCSAIASVA